MLADVDQQMSNSNSPTEKIEGKIPNIVNEFCIQIKRDCKKQSPINRIQNCVYQSIKVKSEEDYSWNSFLLNFQSETDIKSRKLDQT